MLRGKVVADPNPPPAPASSQPFARFGLRNLPNSGAGNCGYITAATAISCDNDNTYEHAALRAVVAEELLANVEKYGLFVPECSAGVWGAPGYQQVEFVDKGRFAAFVDREVRKPNRQIDHVMWTALRAKFPGVGAVKGGGAGGGTGVPGGAGKGGGAGGSGAKRPRENNGNSAGVNAFATLMASGGGGRPAPKPTQGLPKASEKPLTGTALDAFNSIQPMAVTRKNYTSDQKGAGTFLPLIPPSPSS